METSVMTHEAFKPSQQFREKVRGRAEREKAGATLAVFHDLP